MSKPSLAEDLARAEQRISAAASKAGASWSWASYSRPSSGGPFLWNDIVVKSPQGKSQVVSAIDFCHLHEES